MRGVFEFRGQEIFYRIKGHGPVIVMIHGFMESMEIWDHYVKELSGHFTVITLDLPGHGRSGIIDPIHSMELMADVVHELLNLYDIKSAVIVGHSMGGYVALACARKHKIHVKGMVLFHSHAAADTREAKLNRDRAIRIIKNDRTGFILNFFPDLFFPGNVDRYELEISSMREQAETMKPESIIAALEGMKLRPDSLDVLREADFPVLFIAGKQDPRIPPEMLQSQSMAPRHAELSILDRVGHMGFLEARKETCKMIDHFALRFL